MNISPIRCLLNGVGTQLLVYVRSVQKDLHNELERFNSDNNYIMLNQDYNDIISKDELTNWFVDSVLPNDEPVWTEKHINELLDNFYVIPKDQ